MASQKDRINSSRKSAGKADANSVSASSTVASSTSDKKPTAPVTVAANSAAPVAAAVAAPVAKAVATPVTIASPVTSTSSPATTAAVSTLDSSRDRSGIVALITKLRDQDAEVARDAAATLGRLPADAQSVDALSAVLVNTDGYFHSVVRAAAAASLGALGNRSAVDALIHATGDSMAEASEEAIKALGLLGDRRALPALEAIVRNDNGFFLENVRRTAQESVARISGTKAKA